MDRDPELGIVVIKYIGFDPRRWPGASCQCHANRDEWRQKLIREGESDLAPFDQNLRNPFDFARLRHLVMNVVSRLLTEGLLVRI